jgi:biopolymer transport protein ExbD
MSVLKEIMDEKCEMEMTPMIDVTFLLLIFFVCTIKFKTLEGKLAAYLPKDVGVNASDAEPKEKIDITLKLKAAGRKVEARRLEKDNIEVKWNSIAQGEFALLDHEVEYGINRDSFPDTEAGIRDMKVKLNLYLADDPERAVTIKAMQGIVYADVIPVLDACIVVGFNDVTFAGSYGK